MSTNNFRLNAARIVIGGALLAALATSAAAQDYGRRHAHPDIVVAESRWGKGAVAGPVRRGRHGWQVRLPRGTWIDCGKSCSETLRRQTVDFWESQGPHARDSGPSYFHWTFPW